MEDQRNNWLNNPSTTQMIWFSILWIVGISLLVLSMTDLFTASPFNSRYLILYFLMAGATITTIKMHVNYWQNR